MCALARCGSTHTCVLIFFYVSSGHPGVPAVLFHSSSSMSPATYPSSHQTDTEHVQQQIGNAFSAGHALLLVYTDKIQMYWCLPATAATAVYMYSSSRSPVLSYVVYAIYCGTYIISSYHMLCYMSRCIVHRRGTQSSPQKVRRPFRPFAYSHERMLLYKTTPTPQEQPQLRTHHVILCAVRVGGMSVPYGKCGCYHIFPPQHTLGLHFVPYFVL